MIIMGVVSIQRFIFSVSLVDQSNTNLSGAAVLTHSPSKPYNTKFCRPWYFIPYSLLDIKVMRYLSSVKIDTGLIIVTCLMCHSLYPAHFTISSVLLVGIVIIMLKYILNHIDPVVGYFSAIFINISIFGRYLLG